MKHFVLVVGLPQFLSQHIKSSDQKALAGGPNGHCVVIPVRESKNFEYDFAYRRKVLERICDILEKLPPGEQFTITTAFNRDSNNYSEVVGDFFPYSIVIDYSIGFDPGKPGARRHAKNIFLRDMKKRFAHARDIARRVSNYFWSNDRSTPFLLPIINYDRNLVSNSLRNILKNIDAGVDIDKSIADERRKFDKKANTIRVQVSKKSSRNCYINRDGLIFRPPGTGEMHGYLRTWRDGTGHMPRCYIAARCRLGGGFNPRFHYDCSLKAGDLRETYLACHGQMTQPQRSTHVNISPNDFVR